MKLESVGILISMRPFGERDSIARIFTRDNGLMCGVMRGAQVAKKNRPLVGQFGRVSWNARLDSQLGTFHWESERNMSALLMPQGNKLIFMNSAFDLISALLPERESFATLYQETLELLSGLIGDDAPGAYLRWEVALLWELGYGLDLSTCGGCGTHDKLHYLSPRTGHAVCENCGAPYIDKLYKLPLSLNITLHFLEHACTAQGVQIPASRKIL